MAEYIDLEASETLLCEERDKLSRDEKDRYLSGVRDGLNMAHSLLLGIETADVKPVRRGRWEWSKDYYGDSILVCSECGRVCHEEDAPYCYCGCKMDLEAADA